MPKALRDKNKKLIRVGDRVIIHLNDEPHVAKIQKLGNKWIEVIFQGEKGPRIAKVRSNQTTKYSRRRPKQEVDEDLYPGAIVKIFGMKGRRNRWMIGREATFSCTYHYGEMAMVKIKAPKGTHLKEGHIYEIGVPIGCLRPVNGS